LGLCYRKQKDYDNMMKYYIMAIELNDDEAKNNLNEHINETDNIQDLIKYKTYLNKENKEKYDKKYINYLQIKKYETNNIKMEECCVCLEDNYMVGLKCN